MEREILLIVFSVIISAICSGLITFHVSRFKLRKSYNHMICDNIQILDTNIKILVQSMFEFNGLGKQFKEVYKQVQEDFENKLEIKLNP